MENRLVVGKPCPVRLINTECTIILNRISKLGKDVFRILIFGIAVQVKKNPRRTCLESPDHPFCMAGIADKIR
jgi:hypothetical protein